MNDLPWETYLQSIQGARPFVEPELEPSGPIVRPAPGGGTVAAGSGRRQDRIGVPGQTVVFPQLVDGRVLEGELTLVVQVDEGLDGAWAAAASERVKRARGSCWNVSARSSGGSFRRERPPMRLAEEEPC